MQVQAACHNAPSRRVASERTALPFPSRSKRIKKCPTPVTHKLRGSTLTVSKRHKHIHNAAKDANEALYTDELRDKGQYLKAAVELGLISEKSLSFLMESDPLIRVDELNDELNRIINTLNQSLVSKIKSVGEMLHEEYDIPLSVTENALDYVSGGVGYMAYEDKLTYCVSGMAEHIFYETQYLGEHCAVGQALVAELIGKADGAPMVAMLDYASGLFDGFIDTEADKKAYTELLELFEQGDQAHSDYQVGINEAPAALAYFEQFVRGVAEYAKQGKHYDVLEEILSMRCDEYEIPKILKDPELTEQAAYAFGETISDGLALYELSSVSKENPELLKTYVSQHPDSQLAGVINGILATVKKIDYGLFGDDMHEDNFADTAFIHCPIGEKTASDLQLDGIMQRYHMMMMECGEGDSNYPIELCEATINSIEDRAVNLYLALVFAQYLDDLAPDNKPAQ